ncbi:hypothetical protein O181_001337 [Austropuccinia psidii MF-1]|uniref:Uncharacterized protein n=1 Tax=Austropuccinia psidii MF-1 TaxID=1389203 RepID=A0A9Q3GCX8_9BASI|nr:hypothetical protein [Austropuccinia psidii MF-1]
MSPVHLRDLRIPRKTPEARKRLFRSRRSGIIQHGELEETEGNHSHTPIHLPIKQRPQTRGLDKHGSSTSAPPTPQRPVPVEYGTQEVQPAFKLGRNRGNVPEDMSQRDIF